VDTLLQPVKDFLHDPSVIYPFVGRLFGALILFWVGRRIIKVLTTLTARALRKLDADETLVTFISNALYYLLLVALVIAALGFLGFETSSLITILGAAGLSVGLALKDSLSNVASGVMIILFRPFRVGDTVEIAGHTGVVEEIGVFSTQIKTFDNRQTLIPNGQIVADSIVNYTAKPIRRADILIGVSYEDDLKKARQVMQDTIAAHPKVLSEPAPSIYLMELADSSINFSVRPWCQTSDVLEVKSDLMEQLKTNLEAAGCSIPYPQRDVHLYQKKGQEILKS